MWARYTALCRRAASRRRRADLFFELLELRLCLAADFPAAQSSGDGWLLDNDAIDISSVLVRFASPTEENLPHGLQHERRFSLVSGLQRLTVSPGSDVASTLTALRASPSVLYAEPNYRVRTAVFPDDPQFSSSWGLHNSGQTGGIPDADIDMIEAWELSVGSGNTIVAVIDTGVDYTHADLQANMWRNLDEFPGDGVDNDGNGYVDDYYGYDFANDDPNPFDDNAHGTHVAGTIAAVGNNGTGVAGLNWNARIMALKFLNSSGQGTVADAIEALEYAVANGATISNNSWGFYGGEDSTALRQAVQQAQSSDHLFVAAAGNGNFLGIGQDNDTTPFLPASYDLDNIISVAASDHNDNRAIFSNYGAHSVDVAAPGVNILSTTPGGSYQFFQGTSMAAPHVAGLAALLRDVQPSWSYQQTINQILNTVDLVSAFEAITTTGGRINAATALQTAVNPAPEIVVSTAEGMHVQDGTGQLNLHDTAPGLPVVQTIIVKNAGTLPLHLSEPINVPAGYSLAASFGQTTLDPGEATAFALQLEAASEGNFTGEISFGNNDSDENPFNFIVSGTVRTPPPVLVVDNGDSTFETTGEWTLWNGQGYLDDVHESFPGTGQDVASWTFWGLLPGAYRVAATWSTHSNRATNAPFTIWDDQTPLDTVLVNQQLLTDDLGADGGLWEQLGGLVTIDGGAMIVTLTDAADGRVNADAIRIERVPDEPEIEVSESSGALVVDGVSNISFGVTAEGVPLQKTFTIENVGLQPLTLASTINIPSGFRLLSSFTQTTLQPGQATTFVVELEASAPGSSSGQISLSNNDTDENPFNFTISGTVNPPPPSVQTVDNGDAGFTTIGAWTRWTGQGYQNDVHESLPGTGQDVASWTFWGLLPGSYRVAATWSTHSNRATNAPFTIWDDQTQLDTVLVNQQLPSDDFSADGATWKQLGGLVTIDGGALVVTLTDAADGRVNADAIRIERVPDEPEIEVSDSGGARLVDGVSHFSFGITAEGVPLQRSFTVENVGLQPLAVDSAISLPTGFRLLSGFAQTTLQPGQATTLVVELEATVPGSYSGQVSFANSDQDENPFDFTISGTVDSSPPPVQTVDNGDAGFTTVGAWTRWTGQGYQSDVHESLPGTGQDVAHWTFAGLLPGTYRVGATWSTYSNRAANAPFTIWNDQTQLDTVLVNQQLSPDDFSADGAIWEQLGELVTIDGAALVVTLSDAADGRVNADAIRIERLPDPMSADLTIASTAQFPSAIEPKPSFSNGGQSRRDDGASTPIEQENLPLASSPDGTTCRSRAADRVFSQWKVLGLDEALLELLASECEAGLESSR